VPFIESATVSLLGYIQSIQQPIDFHCFTLFSPNARTLEILRS